VDRVLHRIQVPEELAGRRFDQAAAELLTDFSRSRLKVWIQTGELMLDGRQAEPRTRVRGGEELSLDARIEPAVPIEPEAIPLDLIHEDRAYWVIDKPAGLVVHPGAGNWSGTMQNALLSLDPAQALLPRAGIVHRLDKDTSGVLVVARSLDAHAALVAQLERREVQRLYEGICQGVLTGGGVVDAPVGRHRRDRLKMAVVANGRAAVTHYRVLERFRAHTHVRLKLETGRTHQIRVHLAHLRMPLVGDPLYGGRPRLPKAPSARLREQLQGFTRQALHASRLQFTHPDSGRQVSYASPLPSDLAILLQALGEDALAAGGDRP